MFISDRMWSDNYFLQVFPVQLLSAAYADPVNQHLIERSEVKRHGKYIKLLKECYSHCYPDLVTLVIECLDNVPDHRPATDKVLTRLQRMKMEVEGVNGIVPDIIKVLYALDIKKKERKIEELIQEEVYTLD